MKPSAEEKPAPIIFGDESLSDVTLVVDKQEFKIHKMVPASRSDVFKAMFYGEFKESKQDRIEIKDVSVDNFRRLLDIIYTGKTRDATSSLEFPFDGTTHRHMPSFYGSGNKILQNFWENNTEMLKIADRFNITSIVKDYFSSVIAFDIKHCDRKECHQCFNSFIFALIHGLDVSKCQKTYPKYSYHTWIAYADEKPFPEMVPLKAMKAMHQKLSD